MGICSSSKKPNEKPNLTPQTTQQPQNITVTQKSPENTQKPVNVGYCCDNGKANNSQNPKNIDSNGKLLKPGEIGFNGDVDDGQEHTVDFRKKCTKKGGTVD